jgi:GNAT superfamily N-acetyltransferase
MPGSIWLIPLKRLDSDVRDIKLGQVAGLELAAGQEDFVGEPLKMMMAALADTSRLPYVIESNGDVLGILTLQAGAASLAGWHDEDPVWLLRGFLIDRKHQGRGFGTSAAAAAVEEARKVTVRAGGGQAGVVLSVHERNFPALRVYVKAGFRDRGRYVSRSSGAQRIMYKGFQGPGD